MSEYKLTADIVALSQGDIWDIAKLEWDLSEIYQTEEPDTCLCGHFPIIEICILKNKFNHNLPTVGNCCVKKFIGLPSDKIFQAVKRIGKDNQKSINAEAIQHVKNKNWLNNWEYDFYMDIMRKRKLSSKQLQKKTQINQKFIDKMKK
jgi:hypothetical protein